MSLSDFFKDQVKNNLAKHAGDFLGEEHSDMSTAVEGSYSTFMASLIEKGKDKAGAKEIFNSVSSSDDDILNQIERIFTRSPQTVNGLVNVGTRELPKFISNQRMATNLIASKSSISKDSSSKFMKMGAPFFLGMIGKQVRENNLDTAGMMNLINGTKSHVKSGMPSGMTDALELSSFGWTKKIEVVEEKPIKKPKPKKEKKIEEVKEAVVAPVTDNNMSGGMGWLKWLIPLLLILAAIIFFGIKGCNPVDKVGSAVAATTEKVTETAAAATETVSNAVGNTLGAVNDMALKALDGISFAAGSAGEQMMGFIKGGAEGEGKFRFKNLTFATGSANIDGSSGSEVDNLASILKAFTDVKVAINGYTDNTGNPTSNQTLSEQRAQAVQNRLVEMGIDAGRLTAAGFGDADPFADNGTAEGRAENRRIEVVIMK